MSHCQHQPVNSSVYQTLDELDFERGIWCAAQSNDIPKVLNLINKGVNVDVEDKSGYTALHYASRNGHLEMCKLLISFKANVNSLTKAGKVSPLHRSVSAGHLDICKLLLDAGARTDLKDADGKTILHRAAEAGNKNIVQLILEIDPKLKYEPDNKGNLPNHYSLDNVKKELDASDDSK